MPIYSYACSECETELTEMRRVADRDSLRVHDEYCKGHLIRGIDTPGAVWAPTSTGSNLK